MWLNLMSNGPYPIRYTNIIESDCLSLVQGKLGVPAFFKHGKSVRPNGALIVYHNIFEGNPSN